jgi:hypothetical protein
MAHAFRPLRSRFARLLASVLVVAALLGNGLAMAQGPTTPAKKECCAEKMAHKHATAGCAQAGDPCPTPSVHCDDQCLLQCQAIVVLPMLVGMSPLGDLAQAALPPLFTHQRPSADPGPDLRPPISA